MPELTTVAKDEVCAAVDSHRDLLRSVARSIHAHPEENFAEHHAHDVLTDAIESAGLDVTRSAYGLPTAFSAAAGSTGPLIAVLCEYDALPGLGHACGHNLIAAAGLGAGLAAASLAERLGGRVLLVGTPGEEGGGGKAFMIDRGAFDGVDAAMMIHPADVDLRWMTTIAYQRLTVEFHGEAAHAAAAPWNGRNALDAAVLGYMNVAALRQHIRPDERIHGVFTDGGDKPNIVPAHAAMDWYVRAPDRTRLEALKPRVLAALRSGAEAAGCDFDHQWHDPAYDALRRNPPLEELFAVNAAALGRTLAEPGDGGEVVGSTDMGNVSQVVPSIHPMLAVAPRGVGIHTVGFAEHAASASGDEGVLVGAKAMAMTIVDLWTRPDTLARCREAFAASV
ncbi:MAG: M20 family metallopeptidase [Acidimicrobiia bacterium]|nr:M20 family metallopeptidase [Acidimicrobiia bacterium]